jgi:hypothetical protein
VASLVSALKSYKGGIVLVSHDARLVQGLDCDLWICGDDQGGSGGGGRCETKGLRVEAQGYARYRKDIVKKIEQREAAAEAAAAARVEVRRRQRAAKLAKFGASVQALTKQPTSAKQGASAKASSGGGTSTSQKKSKKK